MGGEGGYPNKNHHFGGKFTIFWAGGVGVGGRLRLQWGWVVLCVRLSVHPPP